MIRHTADPSGLRSASVALAVVLLLAIPCAGMALAQTPPLGEVARKEAERRKAQPSADKVYTGKDLPAPARAPVPPSEPQTSPDAEPAPADATTAAESATDAKRQPVVRGEAWWKARIVKAREVLAQNEALAESLQSRINALSRSFVSRDDPVQRARIGEERAEALTELAAVHEAIARGRQQIEDIEEEARRTGVPPGWLR